MTLRPDTHFSRIRCCKETILIVLAHRISEGRWPPFFPSPRMRHWLANLKRQALVRLSTTWQPGLLGAFDRLVMMEIIPVSRSM